MKIFGFTFGKHKKKNKPVGFPEPSEAEQKDQIPATPAKTLTIAKLPRIRNPALSFKLRPGADEFEQPEYDMAEIGRIEDVEAYVQRAFTQKEGLMFKEGWEITGKDNQTIRYIKQRFEQFSAATGVPFATVLRGIGEDLIRYSNAFLVKVRDRKASGGKPRRIVGRAKQVDPVAGYFPIPVSTVRFKRDDNGKILRYRQLLPNGKYKDFSPDNVIHISFRKKKGFLAGTPSLIPVKDDIRALRRIEENIEMLIYQHLFPLYHYQVGTPDAPASTYSDGTREIDVVKQQVELMPAEGMIVTPERHNIEAVGAEGRALRAEGYLTHFKQRIFAGLGVSAIDMGEGATANRSCYSEDTETLTDSGFKKYWEITEDDKIATYNPKTNQLEFRRPNGTILLYDYRGKMYHFQNHNVDVMVTPDHDMWMGRPLWNETKYEKIRAEDIDILNYKFLSGGLEWNGIEPEDFRLPYVHWVNHANVGPFPRIQIEDWLEFLGYYVSEGCLAKAQGKWAVTLSQNSFVNSDKTRKIRACLERLPFKFQEYTDPIDRTTRFWINCKSLYLYLQENCKDYSYLKQLPTDIVTYSTRLLRIVFEAMMLGDCTSDIRQGRTSRTYYSTSSTLINQIQEIAIKLGYRANVCPVNGSGCQRVCISEHVSANITASQVQTINYNGKVYCFNVPNHLFITRRNGRIGIHGNTADNMSRNMVDDVKHYQRTWEFFVNDYIIKELLLESTFTNPLDEEKLVYVRFNEIDVESKIKVENHAIDAFGGHAITHSELRRIFGKEPLTDEEWKDSFWKLIEEPKIMMQSVDEPWSALAQAVARAASTEPQQSDFDKENIERKKEIAAEQKAKSQNGNGKPGPNSTKKTSGQRAARAKTRPSNQHGTKSGPEKRKSSFVLNDMVAPSNRLTKLYTDLQSDILHGIQKNQYDIDWLKQLVISASNVMVEHMMRLARIDFRAGYQTIHNEPSYPRLVTSFSILENRINRIIRRFADVLIMQIDHNVDVNDPPDIRRIKLAGVFDSLKFRSRFIYNSERNKAYNYGILQALRATGHTEGDIVCEEDACEKCLNHAGRTDITYLTLSDIPGFHTNCMCKLAKSDA